MKKVINVRLDNQEEVEWANNQKNLSQSIRLLIQRAKQEFGGKDFIESALSIATSNEFSQKDNEKDKQKKKVAIRINEKTTENNKAIKKSKIDFREVL